MMSPFPGMDPYLEEPSEWTDFHSRFINAISESLAERVSPNFRVRIEERVYISIPDDPDRRPIAPDVYVVAGSRTVEQTAAVGEITTPTLVEAWYDLDIRDRYIEVRDARGREVITTMEVLSPFNKAPGTQGREAFMRKRKLVMASNVHWIEIDLLRAGERPPEVVGKSDYYALLKRGGGLGPFAIWYFDLRDKLPTIAVPLRPPFADVPLDLGAVLNQTYARGYYADSLDYAQRPPAPRLRPTEAAWTEARIRDWQAARGEAAGESPVA